MRMSFDSADRRQYTAGENSMSKRMTRRSFATMTTGVVLASASDLAAADEKPPSGPTEAPFERDYPAPAFKPSWKRPQINRAMVQDFVIYAHSDLEIVE